MKAFTYELYLILGIFIPLIVTNCAILGRAEAFASKNNVISSALDGFMMGAGFAVVLLVIGTIREIFGVGTIFANMDLLFGPIAANWTISLFGEGYGFLILVLPPGAFIVTGMLIALKNILDSKLEQLDAARKEPLVKGAKRMRTTGTIS
jgi:electron transport complex protein RnfE